MVGKHTFTAWGVAVALAVPCAPALAAGHGHAAADRGGHGHHGRVASTHGHHGGAQRPAGRRGHGLRQLEGTVVAVDSSSLSLQTTGSRAMTVTVAISTGTPIVAEQGATSTLATGEVVHVVARVDASGAYTATLVRIQRDARPDTRTSDATETPEATDTPEATATPGASDASGATATPGPDDSAANQGHGQGRGHGHGGGHKH